MVIVLNQEVKMDTGALFMTFKLLKRRYRSSDDSETLRSLNYFNHPYEEDNAICLIDDVGLDQPLSLYSLSAGTPNFITLDQQKKKEKEENGRETRSERSKKILDDFEPFDMDNKDSF